MPTYVPSGPNSPQMPPRPGAPSVLKILIAVVLLGFVVGLVLYGIFVSRLIAHLRPGASSRSVAARQPPFSGPNPWKPTASRGGPGRYRMDVAGFELDLPAEPVAESVQYSEQESAQVSRYFNYHFDLESSPVFGFLHGIQYPSGFPVTVDQAGDTFEDGYRLIDDYANVRFTRKRATLQGRPVMDLVGSFQYDGQTWYVEGFAFVGGSYCVSVGVSSSSREGLSAKLGQMRSTVKWFEPHRPGP